MARTLHFKSKAHYKRWLAYLWANKKVRRKYAGKPPHKKIIIAGKPHKVKH